MRYENFRDRFEIALQQAGLLRAHLSEATETIDISSTDRLWRVWIGQSLGQEAEPFSVSGKVSFRWSPANTARSQTCEEDLLTELYDRDLFSADTVPRLVRVDIHLYAKLPYGSTTPIPETEVWQSWSDSVEAGLAEALPRDDVDRERRLLPAVKGWRGDIEVLARYTGDDKLSLEGVSVSAFQLVPVPRVWDDPEKREKEPGVEEYLDELVGRIKLAMDEWRGSLVALGRWIRVGPPPHEKTQDPVGDIDDDEPETIH
jgi:hypothetical protein